MLQANTQLQVSAKWPKPQAPFTSDGFCGTWVLEECGSRGRNSLLLDAQRLPPSALLPHRKKRQPTASAAGNEIQKRSEEREQHIGLPWRSFFHSEARSFYIEKAPSPCSREGSREDLLWKNNFEIPNQERLHRALLSTAGITNCGK